MEPCILSTERLVLRPWQGSDIDAVLSWAKDERFIRFLPLPWPYEHHHAVQFVTTRTAADWSREPGFAITLGGRVIGDVNVRVEAEHARAEVGYGIHPDCWGKGLVTEAARAVISWAFATYGLEKVVARADAENKGSWRVMEKLGMKREAFHRSHRILRGDRRDEVVYGVLRSEWTG